MLTHKVIAKILLRAEDGIFLTIRRSQTDPRRPLQWDLPGGQVEEAENFNAAVAREVKEETDLDISAKKIELIYAKTEMGSEGSMVFLFYFGTVSSKTVKISWEHDLFKWVSLQELQNLIDYPLHRELLSYMQDNFSKELKA